MKTFISSSQSIGISFLSLGVLWSPQVNSYSSSVSTPPPRLQKSDPSGVTIGETPKGITRVRPLHSSSPRAQSLVSESASVRNSPHDQEVESHNTHVSLLNRPNRLTTFRNSTKGRSKRKITPAFDDNGRQRPAVTKKKESSALLTREEEITLTTDIQKLKSVIKIRDELSLAMTESAALMGLRGALPRMIGESRLPYEHQPLEEEWAKACKVSVIQLRRILIAGRDSRNWLTEANSGLVMQIAKKYFRELRRSVEGANGVGTILTLQDMVQEGNLGLMEAAGRFDSSKGARFGTYATYWIKQRVLRSIADHSRVIRLPVHVHTSLRNIRKGREEMEKEIGRTPSLPELAHRLEIPVEKLRLYEGASRPVLSLEGTKSNGSSAGKAGAGEREKRTIGALIASDTLNPWEEFEFESLKQDIRETIDGLGDERERDVLIWRFGLDDGKPRSIKETAEKLGLTKDIVRMVEARAINKLRHPQRNHRLKDYVGHHNDRPIPEEGNFYERFQPRSANKSRSPSRKGDSLSTFSPEQIWSV